MRAPNMQALTDNVRAAHPGVVIYGLGDAAHRAQSSDHNEDDTVGVRTPQTDADTVPEHRAIDVMIGPAFSRTDAAELVSVLVGRPANRARLSLVIYGGYEYSRRTGFERVRRTTDLHLDHVHVSGYAADDDNRSAWSVSRTGGTSMDLNTMHVGPNGESVALGTAVARLYNGGCFNEGGTLVSSVAILDRIEAKIDALTAAVERLAAAGGGGGVQQEQLDAAVLQALSGARFETRVIVGE